MDKIIQIMRVKTILNKDLAGSVAGNFHRNQSINQSINQLINQWKAN
jgi:hypothetical protein